jgi:hypothetical protein
VSRGLAHEKAVGLRTVEGKVSNRTSLYIGLSLSLALVLTAPGCESVPLTAAPGSSMTLIANPTFVIANGGVSVLTAILVEPAGTFVPDGTEVFFFTNLGRVDAVGKTRNGVARVNFVSDARSGIATVQAISGGPAVTPSATPSPASGSGVQASSFASAATTPAPAAALNVAAAQNSASVEIAIGSQLPERVIVTADPQRITSPRNARIVATVLDQFGNPVQNVPVSFSITDADPLVEETLDSGGALLYTNANGQVTDTLRTQAPIGLGQKTVTVTATTANGIEGSVTVFID